MGRNKELFMMYAVPGEIHNELDYLYKNGCECDEIYDLYQKGKFLEARQALEDLYAKGEYWAECQEEREGEDAIPE